jgi:pSer/pThr/pTyr-binding forkhead associated (FHA) protein
MVAYLEPAEDGRRVVLDKAVILFGRHADCDVVLLRSRKVSRKHCCIAQVNDKYVIRDLGSLNGIRVNGNRVRKETRIRPGDEVTIGDVRYFLREEKVANGEATSQSAPRAKAPPPARKKHLRPMPSAEHLAALPADEQMSERDTPVGIPVADEGEEYFEIDDEDVELLEDEKEREDSGWQVEALPE